MNINFGLFPEIATPEAMPDGQKLKGKARGRAKKQIIAERALRDLATWLQSTTTLSVSHPGK
jgi:methylenetetrahydrofolate--tRNA-(uracil-5-)-methyltransferase